MTSVEFTKEELDFIEKEMNQTVIFSAHMMVKEITEELENDLLMA